MKSIFTTFLHSAVDGVANGIIEHIRERKAAEQAQEATTNLDAYKYLVKCQWLDLISAEGTDAAKRFMQECRERQICPSSHLDLTDFLEAGKAALKAFNHPPINSTI